MTICIIVFIIQGRSFFLKEVVMKRIPEPEIMEDENQAIAYAQADFSDSNQLYVDLLKQEYGNRLTYVIDIGCGPADVPIRLAKALPGIHIIAVDASYPMVQIARKAVVAHNLSSQIEIIHDRIPELDFDSNSFDGILSKDLLHHLPDPDIFWTEASRICKNDGILFVMDLIRPGSKEAARSMVDSVSGDEDPLLKTDFYNSLLSSFSIQEVKEQIKKSHLQIDVKTVSSRHYLAKGHLFNEFSY